MIELRHRPASKAYLRPLKVLLALAAIAAGLSMVYVAYTAQSGIPGRSYYTLKAEFDNADNITNHAEVRVGGRLIGQVLDPRVEGRTAVVDLQLYGSERPLRSDTSLQVRPGGAIGQRFIDVRPGTRGRPLREGETIPASQTSHTVALDEVLSALDAPTRRNARTLLHELGAGTLGRGEDLNAAIASAPRFLADTASVAQAITSRQGAASRFIRSAEQASAAFDPVRRELAEGFRPWERTLRPFATEADAVRATLERAPGALGALRTGLTRTDPLLAELSGLAGTLEPALDVTPGALTEAAALLREARPGLRRARGTLRLAGRASPDVERMLRSIGPVLPAADAAARSAIPMLQTLTPFGCDITSFMYGWAQLAGSVGDDETGVFLVTERSGPSPQSVSGTGEAVRNRDSTYAQDIDPKGPGPCPPKPPLPPVLPR